MSNYYLAVGRSGAFEIRWTEHNGKRPITRTLSTGTDDREEAAKILEDFVSEVNVIARQKGEPRVNDVLDPYVSLLEAKGASETNTYAIMQLRKHFGAARLSSITTQRIIEYGKARDVAPVTLRRELSCLQAAINLAVRDRLIKRDDAPHIQMPEQGEPRQVFLDEEQLKLFLVEAAKLSDGMNRLTRLHRFIFLAAYTGQRGGAIRELTWDRVNFTTGMIDFRSEGERITNKKKGVVPMNKSLRAMMERAHAERTSDHVLDHAGLIRKSFERWVRKTEWPHIHIHDLRRSFATNLLMKGVPLTTVAGLINDNPATMLRTYAVYMRQGAQDAVDLLD